MHACGHDVHTTVGLGTAMVLSRLTDELRGNVRFLFQPGEETAEGASWMVEDGVMEKVTAILSLHVYPSIPAGSIGIRYGALTAAADDLEIIIMGESGHGARPHEAIDAIWIASQVITTLQQAISRTQNPLRPMVLSIGQINGGRAKYNCRSGDIARNCAIAPSRNTSKSTQVDFPNRRQYLRVLRRSLSS